MVKPANPIKLAILKGRSNQLLNGSCFGLYHAKKFSDEPELYKSRVVGFGTWLKATGTWAKDSGTGVNRYA